MGYHEEIAAHRARRLTQLLSEGGWPSVVGRWVLDVGPNELPIGTAFLEAGRVRVVTKPGVTWTVGGRDVTEHVLSEGRWPSDPLVHGTTTYALLRVGDTRIIQARDTESVARRGFRGLEFYAPKERYHVRARLLRYDPVRTVPLLYPEGASVDRPSPGVLVFELDGHELRLEPTLEDEGDLFVAFADETNADETYEAGRFLTAKMPAEGDEVDLDFNKAFNPPCAFTTHVVCPVVTPAHRLSLRVEAGEKRYRGPIA